MFSFLVAYVNKYQPLVELVEDTGEDVYKSFTSADNFRSQVNCNISVIMRSDCVSVKHHTHDCGCLEMSPHIPSQRPQSATCAHQTMSRLSKGILNIFNKYARLPELKLQVSVTVTSPADRQMCKDS